MGVGMTLQAASDQKIDELARDARALDDFIRLGGNEDSANGAALQAILANASALDPRFNSLIDIFGWRKKAGQELGPSLDLDRSFQALHYLFTGSPYQGREPQCFLLHGGRDIGLYQREFKVRAISSSQLIDFELALRPIDEEELMRRYNGKAMTAADIYPAVMWDRGDDEARNFLCEKLKDLKRFLERARAINEGMVMCVR